MDLEEPTAFSVTTCEVRVIPGTGYAFIQLGLVEENPQAPSDRRFVFSYSQLSELRDEIESALRIVKDPVKADPPIPKLH